MSAPRRCGHAAAASAAIFRVDMPLSLRFLGTSASRPTVERGVSSIALEREGETFLFDCGEGTQRQMMRYGVSFNFGDVFFSHFHTDHYLGIIGLLRTMALQGRTETLRCWGPRGTTRMLKKCEALGADRHVHVQLVAAADRHHVPLRGEPRVHVATGHRAPGQDLELAPLVAHDHRALAELDWVRITQSQFAPVEITPEFWIVPSWHEVPAAAKRVIRLDPGLAFGTGTHPTTRMCLRWIARQAGGMTPRRVIDYGCGSGILGIAAALHGAAAVDGVDIDPAAVESARLNAQANGVQLRAGMMVEAQIRTGERSFGRYLLQPVFDSFHRAFREQ